MSWSMTANHSLYPKYSSQTMVGGQDHSILEQETQGLVTVTTRIDTYYITEQRRETRHKRSVWRGTIQMENHNVERGEFAFAILERNRRTNTDPTARPKVITSLSGAALDQLPYPPNDTQEEMERYVRKFMRRITVLGLATSQVITQLDSRMNNEDQGVVVQIAGIFNGYSPLEPMTLGALVGVRAPLPQEAHPENANWNPRKDTHRNKVVLVPTEIRSSTVSTMARKAIIETLKSPKDFAKLSSPRELEEDLDVRITNAALQNAAMNGLVLVDLLLQNGTLQVGAGVAAAVVGPNAQRQQLLANVAAQLRLVEQTAKTTNMGTGGIGVVPANDPTLANFAKRAFIDRTTVNRPEFLIGFERDANHPGLTQLPDQSRGRATNEFGQLIQRQLDWPLLMTAIFDQQLDVARNVQGRVTQAGRLSFKYVR